MGSLRLLDEGWSPESTSHEGKLKMFSPAPHSLEKEEGLRVELMIHHKYIMKSHKSTKSIGFGELPGGWCSATPWGLKLLHSGPSQNSSSESFDPYELWTT